MAEFNAGSVVFVPLPTAPEMVLWATPGPKGDPGDGGGGGSTDASLLTGALTSDVDASAAMVSGYAYNMSLGNLLDSLIALADVLESKSDVGHTHPVTELDATGARSSSNYLRGDGSWATPPNNVYPVPTQAEAEAGTATSGRAFSAQRVRQAADAAITAREWVGTQAQYDAIGTKNPNITYYIVD